MEKLRYIHRNPVVRGLVERPEDWQWSSFRHYLTSADGVVEIESNGQHGGGRDWESYQWFAFVPTKKAPPKQSLNGGPDE